jgi:Zn-dependent alcohol dehydrogenase
MKNLDVRGAFSGSVTHYREALLFLEQEAKRFDFDKMITSKYSLDQVNDALLSMREMRDIKPVILMHQN